MDRQFYGYNSNTISVLPREQGKPSATDLQGIQLQPFLFDLARKLTGINKVNFELAETTEVKRDFNPLLKIIPIKGGLPNAKVKLIIPTNVKREVLVDEINRQVANAFTQMNRDRNINPQFPFLDHDWQLKTLYNFGVPAFYYIGVANLISDLVNNQVGPQTVPYMVGTAILGFGSNILDFKSHLAAVPTLFPGKYPLDRMLLTALICKLPFVY